MFPEPSDQRPASYETAFLTVEGNIADFFVGTDRTGSGDEGGTALALSSAPGVSGSSRSVPRSGFWLGWGHRLPRSLNRPP